MLLPILLTLWVANRKVYGAHKLWKAARRAGHDIGRDQVARLMRQLGIEGVRRGRRVRTTRRDDTADRAPDLVSRDFTASVPNQLWVMDLERHEAPLHRAEVKGLRGWPVAAGR
jgi:putative transposase